MCVEGFWHDIRSLDFSRRTYQRLHPALRLLARRLPCFLQRSPVFQRHDNLGPFSSEVLQVETFNEQGQRRLPGLLAMIVDLAELSRVHSQLPRHLHMRMREAMAFARF